MSVLISVIIATRNAEKTLPACLRSLLNQTVSSEKIECIVVDNNSSDHTLKIASRYCKKIFTFGPERSAQRNFGFTKAQGKYILILDADMRLSAEVIAKAIHLLEKTSSTIALYIPEIIEGQSLWSRIRTFERSFYTGTAVDAVRCIRTETFRRLKGYDVGLTGVEDWDLDKRIRMMGKTAVLDACLYHDETGMNIFSFTQKKRYYSKYFTLYKNKWGKDDPDIKVQLQPIYRFYHLFIRNGNWKKVMAHPLLALLMIMLRLSSFVMMTGYWLVRREGPSYQV